MSDAAWFWISWYGASDFSLSSPWWVSGYRADGADEAGEQRWTPTICAAVPAASEDEAREIVIASHDVRPGSLEWRFCEARTGSPFSDRFRRATWMQWEVADA